MVLFIHAYDEMRPNGGFKVYSMGTENRRPAAEYIPPNDMPYEFIIFRATEVKDLAVDQPPPQPLVLAQRAVHEDPAVLVSLPNCHLRV
jgi:hypothetical protein